MLLGNGCTTTDVTDKFVTWWTANGGSLCSELLLRGRVPHVS